MQHVDSWKSLCSMSEQAFMINGKIVNSLDHIQSAFPKATKACSGCQGCQKLVLFVVVLARGKKETFHILWHA